MYVWTYCSERFANERRLEKRDSRSRFQVLEQKYWELSLEIKGSEYIVVLPLNSQFSLNVLKSCNTANKLAAAACKQPISTAILFFSISSNRKITCNTTYHWSFISYNLEFPNFYKMKTLKISYRRSKYLFHPEVRIFIFQPELKGSSFISKKMSPDGGISPRGEFHFAYV